MFVLFKHVRETVTLDVIRTVLFDGIMSDPV